MGEYTYGAIDPDFLGNAEDTVAYRPKTGDSLASLAEKLGCTWESIAILNWGTTDLDEVTWYLHNFVGCTIASGGTFVFDGRNLPGAIRLPKSEKTRSVRVRRGTFYVSRYPIE